MLEEMTLEELRAEHKRALQLAFVCESHGMAQAATMWNHTARALLLELENRGDF